MLTARRFDVGHVLIGDLRAAFPAARRTASDHRSAGRDAEGLSHRGARSGRLPDGVGYWLFIRRQITTDGTIPQLALYHCAGPATWACGAVVVAAPCLVRWWP